MHWCPLVRSLVCIPMDSILRHHCLPRDLDNALLSSISNHSEKRPLILSTSSWHLHPMMMSYIQNRTEIIAQLSVILGTATWCILKAVHTSQNFSLPILTRDERSCWLSCPNRRHHNIEPLISLFISVIRAISYSALETSWLAESSLAPQNVYSCQVAH